MKKILMATLLAVTVMSGCSKDPRDTSFNFTSMETLTESTKALRAALSEEEIQIYEWALGTKDFTGVTTVEKMKELLGENATFRKIVQRAVEERKQPVLDEYERLKSIEKEWTAVYQDLSKIKATNIRLGKSPDFITRGDPAITFDVHNGSSYDLSSIKWEVALFLDDEKEPYATIGIIDSYTYGKKSNGLRAGETVTNRVETINVFTSPLDKSYRKWSDLKTQNAKKRTITATIVPQYAQNFSEEYLISGNVPEAIKQYAAEKEIIEKAEKLL
ncbi:DUF6694 family lipoprotein [Acinetobacter indicus]|uniref:DUF6694 family lipoprotein n=1 Tax=Acinetobacter indicus TaxID=756892 RepID=UPI001443EA59|nr:hypothetical protein [Acinetobacter indicus]